MAMANANVIQDQLAGITSILGTHRVATDITKIGGGGDPKKFRTWIKEVKKYRVVLGANSDCTKTIAYQTAEGPVSDFIQRYSQQNDNVPWDNLKRELTTRFAEITDAQHAMYVLRRTKQKAAETVQLFAERLLELAEDAWPGQSLTTSAV